MKKKESLHHPLYLLSMQILLTHVSTVALKQEIIVKVPRTHASQHSEYLHYTGTEDGFELHSAHTVKESMNAADFAAALPGVLPRPVRNTGQAFPKASFDQ